MGGGEWEEPEVGSGELERLTAEPGSKGIGAGEAIAEFGIGFVKGAAVGAGVSLGLSLMAAPVGTVAAGGLVSLTVYQLAGGGEALVNAGGRLASGKGIAEDYQLAGIVSGRQGNHLGSMGQNQAIMLILRVCLDLI